MITLLAFLLAIGILVSIHEYGHFWVARRCGVKVLRYSLGFGPIIAKRVDQQGTEWALSAIPLGGYVKMLDGRDVDLRAEEVPLAFNHKTLWQRAAIVVAGPMANFLLAVVVLMGLNLTPTQVPKLIIAEPAQGSSAAAQGLQQGDEITSVNGLKVASWGDLRWALIGDTADEIDLSVKRGNTEKTVRLKLPPWLSRLGDKDVFAEVSLKPYFPPSPAVIEDISPGSAADFAGLKTGDQILAINGQKTEYSADASTLIRGKAKQEVALTILRAGNTLELKATPQAQVVGKNTEGRLGIRFAIDKKQLEDYQHIRQFGVLDAFTQALERVYALSKTSLLMLGKMLIGQAPLNQISGPITMADYAGKTANLGLQPFLAYLALLSVSIGVLNLLPIPTLDGGHLLLYGVEAVSGKPPSPTLEEWVHRIGMVILLLFMLLAFYNDIVRYFFTRL